MSTMAATKPNLMCDMFSAPDLTNSRDTTRYAMMMIARVWVTPVTLMLKHYSLQIEFCALCKEQLYAMMSPLMPFVPNNYPHYANTHTAMASTHSNH